MHLSYASVIVIVLLLMTCVASADQALNNTEKSEPLNETANVLEMGKVGGSNSVRDGLGEQQSNAGMVEDDGIKLNGDFQRAESYERKGLSSESKNVLGLDKMKSSDVKEICDSSSNSCTDDENSLVACLTVPGNESPDLSLLIQNRGNGSLSVTVSVSAPDFVQLEKKQFELKEKEDTEVKVSIKDTSGGHFIILNAGHGNCKLDFKTFASKRKDDPTNDSSNVNPSNATNSSTWLFLFYATFVILSVSMSIKFGARCFRRKSTKYKSLIEDMELPILHGSKLEACEIEGWDNSWTWGDSWDDEEALKDGVVSQHLKPFIKKS